MELGEIETHLTRNKKIQHAIVLYPKAGPCKRQLVGVVSLERLGEATNSSNEVLLLPEPQAAAASAEVVD